MHKIYNYMGLLDNYSGIGMSPRPKWQHQMVMSLFLGNAGRELRRKGLLLLTEVTVTDDWDDLAPDLVVFDAEFRPFMIIEITTHKECAAIIRKCEELMARFPEAEYFVYDYEKGELFAFDDETETWVRSEEYEIGSRYLDRPLMAYID